MAEIAIITDSTCDIPQPLIDQYGIIIVPHYVLWGNQEYLDRVNLQPAEFYQRLQTDPIRPTSSQATDMIFAKAYQEAIQRGRRDYRTTVSSAMSGATRWR